MARHRNVRSMNYAEEYDGIDDVYGHSVEDDRPISPTDAVFLFDRKRKKNPQISAFIGDAYSYEDDATDYDLEKVFEKPKLSDLDEAKLRSCMDEIRNVMGDAVPLCLLEEIVLNCNFDVNSSLDTILNEAELKEPRQTRVESRQAKKEKVVKKRDNSTLLSSLDINGDINESKTPSIKIISNGLKTKGFNVTNSSETTFNSLRNQSSVNDSTKTEPKNSQASESRFKTRNTKLDHNKQYETDRNGCKDLLHMVVIGHVDAGKSTLMGHLLYALGQVDKRAMHKYKQESKKLGKQSFAYAWVLDQTNEERSRGITMDIGHFKFETKTKVINLLDAPGHKDFIPHMITGAAQADVAILVIDATTGEFETGFESGGQTREHALLVRSLGVNQLIVAVNKLDTANWSKERFDDITEKLGPFLKQAGFKDSDISYVPCSGLTGENLVQRSSECQLSDWYKGPCLLDIIDEFKVPPRPVSKPLRLSVNDVFREMGLGLCISGRIETGMIQPGDKVLVQPSNELAFVKGLCIDDVLVQSAFAGDRVTLSLANFDIQKLSVGSVLCDPEYPVLTTTKLEARIVIFNLSVPLTKGNPVVFHMQSLAEQAVVVKLIAELNKNSGEVIKKNPRRLLKNSTAIVQIEVSRPICLELYQDVKELGRFLLRVNGVTIAAGLTTKIF